jgi:predicted MFS family arabinose efflux permease
MRAGVTLILLAIATLLVMTTETLPVGLLTPMAKGLGVGSSEIGLLVTVYGAVVVVGAIPLSIWMTRLDPRLSMVVVLLMFVVSIAVTASSSDLRTAVVARLLGGAAHAVFYSCSFTLATSVVRESWQGRAVATVGAGNALALALGVPTATALGTWLGWRVPFWAAAAALVTILIGLAISYRPLHQTQLPAAPSAKSLLTSIKSWPLVRVVVTIVLVMGAHFLTYTYISPILADAGLPEGFISLALVAYGVFGVVGLVVAGRYADTYPARLLKVSVALTLVGLTVLWMFRESIAGVIVALVLWGSAFGAAPVLWQLMAVRAAPAAASIGPAAVNSAFNVGISTGALSGGVLLAMIPPAGLALPSILLVAAALALVLSRQWLPRDVPEALIRSPH